MGAGREPILTLYRPITNLTAETLGPFYKEAFARGITPKHLIPVGDLALRPLISSGDLYHFFSHIQVDPTSVDVEELASYLEQHMSSSTDRVIEAPTYPFEKYVSTEHKKHHVLTLGAGNPTFQAERSEARLLTEEVFGVDSEDTRGAWPSWKYGTGVKLTTTVSLRMFRRIQELVIERPDLLPPVIKLDLVEMWTREEP